jgi:hypothetical protein
MKHFKGGAFESYSLLKEAFESWSILQGSVSKDAVFV